MAAVDGLSDALIDGLTNGPINGVVYWLGFFGRRIMAWVKSHFMQLVAI
jgi:hypothetical protein